ncbi:MAG: cellulose biosynthesis protein BcsS [Xanthobacteraceae bacterium]
MSIASASAADLGPRSTADTSDQVETVAINAGFTLTNPYSAYGDFALLWAPTKEGLDKSGFRVRLSSVDGTYSYIDSTSMSRVYGVGQEQSLLFGYELFNTSGNTSLLLMFGGDVQENRVNAFDPLNPVQGTEFGYKVLGEFYSNPTTKTMLQGEGTYSTAFKSFYSQFEAGYALFAPEVFVGPYMAMLGDEHYAQWRLGGSINGLKFGKLELGFYGGYLHDRDQGSGAFGGVTSYIRF